MVKRLVLRGSKRSERERVSLLLVELRAAPNWLRTRFDRGPVPSSRIVNVLGRETSLETGLHGQVVTRPACLEACGCLPHPGAPRTHRCGQSGHGCRTLALDTGRGHGTGHRTRGHQARGRWTCTGRRTLDTCRTPDTGRPDADTGRPDAGHVDADRATKARWDGDPCCCGRHTRRSATMTARR
jgi:hypothetical protein